MAMVMISQIVSSPAHSLPIFARSATMDIEYWYISGQYLCSSVTVRNAQIKQI